jgi:hypothetical protein
MNSSRSATTVRHCSRFISRASGVHSSGVNQFGKSTLADSEEPESPTFKKWCMAKIAKPKQRNTLIVVYNYRNIDNMQDPKQGRESAPTGIPSYRNKQPHQCWHSDVAAFSRRRIWHPKLRQSAAGRPSERHSDLPQRKFVLHPTDASVSYQFPLARLLEPDTVPLASLCSLAS